METDFWTTRTTTRAALCEFKSKKSSSLAIITVIAVPRYRRTSVGPCSNLPAGTCTQHTHEEAGHTFDLRNSCPKQPSTGTVRKASWVSARTGGMRIDMRVHAAVATLQPWLAATTFRGVLCPLVSLRCRCRPAHKFMLNSRVVLKHFRPGTEPQLNFGGLMV